MMKKRRRIQCIWCEVLGSEWLKYKRLSTVTLEFGSEKHFLDTAGPFPCY